MSKKKLHIDLDFEFSCFGISCHQRDYRLAWNINEALGIKLAKQPTVEIYDSFLKSEINFSKFFFFDELRQLEYLLYANRNEWGFLLPEESFMDYFFLIKGDRFNENVIQHGLRKIEIILSFGKLDPQNLKRKERLLL